MLLINRIEVSDLINYRQEYLECLNHNISNTVISKIIIYVDDPGHNIPKLSNKVNIYFKKNSSIVDVIENAKRISTSENLIFASPLCKFNSDLYKAIPEISSNIITNESDYFIFHKSTFLSNVSNISGIFPLNRKNLGLNVQKVNSNQIIKERQSISESKKPKQFIRRPQTNRVSPIVESNPKTGLSNFTEIIKDPIKKREERLQKKKFVKDLGHPKTIIRKGVVPEVIVEQSTRIKKLDVVIVSVNYNDLLIVSLEHNSKLFENITVVTSSDDVLCQKICKKFGANCIVTDVMYDSDSVFNKARAINEGIKSLNSPDFILLIDADIVIKDKIDAQLLNENILYTSDRWICKSYGLLKSWQDSEIPVEKLGRNEGNKGIGFFQLFNISNPNIDRESPYPDVSKNAAWSDLVFRDKFTIRNAINNTIIHLGDPYKNWDGRVSNKFLNDDQFSEILNKKPTYTICSFYFNYNNDWRQKRNFIKFLEQWKSHLNNVIVGVVDYGDIDFEIPCRKITIEGDKGKRIWSKEILINKIAKEIDTDYLIFTDGDIIYENLDWLDNLETVIGDNDFVQLFETINYLGETGEIIETHKSVASGDTDNVDLLLSKGFRPGGSWMTRTKLLKSKPLFEKMVVGGGDTIMAYGIYGQKNGWTLGKVKEGSVEVYDEAKKWILDFGKRKVGYLKTTINHLYHGDLKDRNYNERYKSMSDKNGLSKGIMLIAFGFDYEKAAIYCLESIRNYSNIPVIIHTNIPEFVRNKELNKFENVFFETHNMNDDENRIIKTQLSKYTIFDKTLYIDVDSSVVSEKFLYPFEYLNEYDVISPEWKTYTKKDIHNLSNSSNKFKKFLKITEKFDFDKKIYIAGGVCYFNRNQKSHKFFSDFHNYWKETGKKEDMPGLNGAMFNNESIVKIINNKEFNNYNSEIIVSHHNSLINYEHLKDFTRKRYNPISDQWEFVDQGTTNLYIKPKIVFVYDIQGWAFYNMAHNIKYHLNKKFEIDIVKFDSQFDEVNYDAIVCFSPGVLPLEIKNHEKIICGISSHKSGKNIEKLKKFKTVFANEKKLFESIQNQNKYYIENGVNTDFFKIEKKKSNKFRIGSLGSEKWSEHKGKFRIEEICYKLGNDFENKSIFIDTNDKIMTQKDVREYYSNIDVLVISSISETGPNTLLEAMSCGIPVISNRVGLAPIIIDNLSDGILIDDFNDIENYVESIKMLRNDTALYENISENSKVKIKKWDWSEKSKDFEEMISEFIKI